MGQVEEIPPEGARRAGRPMSREQFVFLGAGASHGCRTLPLDGVDPTRRPPVVAELFDERYSWARDSYPLVRIWRVGIECRFDRATEPLPDRTLEGPRRVARWVGF